MASEQQLRLKATAEQVAAAARKSREWVAEVRASSSKVGNEADSLVAEARRTENLARKMSRAAVRRMCVGVFGASQQGKSYLVSVLARPSGRRELRARFGAETRDFITELNPLGGTESTGVVTRFTAAGDDVMNDPAYPVELRLLSETDIVKMLANSFQSDFDQNNLQLQVPRGDEIRKCIADCEALRQDRVVSPHLDDIATTDVGEYFYRNFHNRWQELSPVGYWDKLVELAPILPLEARARLFSVLWGGIGDFTNFFRLLVGALERLGHAEAAVAAMASLTPRDAAIIDAGMVLKRIGTEVDEQDRLQVRARRNGALDGSVEVQRAVLAALTAELRITLDEQPWPMFEHTDLLDFPGTRGRLRLINLDSEPEARARQTREMLLRGKVAYLFQRYSEERELTAMLLCMGNKQIDAKDLASMVRQWIDLTHGATWEARRQVPISLFLVLTMMDLEFSDKSGETDDAIAKKWDVRLHASLLELFQHDGWPENFAGTPFNNTLLLRNPNQQQDHLIEYRLRKDSEEPEKPFFELGLSRRNRSYIEKAKRAFFSSSQVAKHFADPRKAWEAMFELNDGGVSYIVEKLGALSDPSLKNIQVKQRLREGASALYTNLKRFYHGVDEQVRREKEAELRELRKTLQATFQPKKFRPFPRLVSYLLVSERDIREIVLNIAALRIEDAPAAVDREQFVDIFGNSPTAQQAPALAAQDDRAARFARELYRHWIGQLRRLPREEALLRHFGLSARTLGDLADQLIIAADRLKLVERVAERVRAATHVAAVRWDDIADRVVTIASHSFNVFVSELGFRDIPLAERPGVPEGAAQPERRVFAPPPPLPDAQLPALGAAPNALELRNFIDWGIALLQVGLANLSFGGGRELTDQQNAALGAIVADLSVDDLLCDRKPT